MQRQRVIWNAVIAASAVLLIWAGPRGLYAQTSKQNPAPATKSADKNLADELRQLREQVAKLQNSVSPKGAAPRPASGMAGMQSMQGGTTQQGGAGMQPQSGMGMMSMMENEHGSSMAASQSAPGMQGMSGMEMSGMDMMGRMARAPQMAGQAALPGFPGLSHLYHIGSTDFFLDHPEHIALTTDQQRQLGQIKETALLEKASTQRKIEETEQQLFTLTGADQPVLADIQAKVREIGELQGQQRIAYIQAVGQAARILTEEQRKSLVGLNPAMVTDPAHDHH